MKGARKLRLQISLVMAFQSTFRVCPTQSDTYLQLLVDGNFLPYGSKDASDASMEADWLGLLIFGVKV